MDIPKIFTVTESAHRIHNPFTPEKLATLGAAVRLQPQMHLLDLGSGSGEMLCSWARDYGITGTGIDMRTFFRQQMRWKRSWLRETLRASAFMWKKEPFMALSFYIGFLLPVLAPLVVVRSMIVVPLELGLFPYKYLMGILTTSMLMSASYLLFKRSNLWPYGIVFCAFYLFVLLWQLPVAVVTFWKSEWGTRNTAADVAAQEKLRYEQQMFVMPDGEVGAEGNAAPETHDSPPPKP